MLHESRLHGQPDPGSMVPPHTSRLGEAHAVLSLTGSILTDRQGCGRVDNGDDRQGDNRANRGGEVGLQDAGYVG